MRPSRRHWPTHKAKKHQIPRRPFEPPWITPPTTGDLARDLVRRGLASPLILDQTRSPRRPE